MTKRAPHASELREWLTARLAEVLALSPAEIDPSEAFSGYGLTSSDVVGVSGDLEEWLGVRLSPTLLYDYPSIEALSQHLAGERSAPRVREAAGGRVGGSDQGEPIAIVGLGCRFPGAENPAAYWRLLADGVDAIREVPAERWDPEEFFDPQSTTPGKMNSRHGGFLQQVDQFEPAFFGISPQEAERMDPQQRLLLELSWEALEDAGVPPERVSGTATGVFVGISTNDYGRYQLRDPLLIDAWAGTGNARSIAANRISYELGLSGPSLAVDTACSSSLVALHLACQSLRAGECEKALVGGVNVMLSPELTMIFAKAGLMAPDGRCKVFDARADGYVRGEGAGVVLLKPLSDAASAGDDVYAVIRGSAVNQDGRSNGLMAPNGPAQEAVIRRAYRDAGVDPGDVGFVEAHGTGTELGDRIEAGALGAALSTAARREACWVGSVKANIGHLEAAAGMAGLIKAVLVLRHRQIPPNPHYDTPNPMIDFGALGLQVPDSLQSWPADGEPARAGVSSFGFGGSNAHVVLEESPSLPSSSVSQVPSRAPESGSWRLLVLSARTPAALDQMSANLGVWLAAHPEVSLDDVAFTLQTGRSVFACRRAVLADSRERAVELLSGALRQESPDEEVLPVPTHRQDGRRDDVPDGHAPGEPDRAHRLRELGRQWLAGGTVEWAHQAGESRVCAGLPTYPFERQRFWLTADPGQHLFPTLSPAEAKSPLADWFHVPAWDRVMLDPSIEDRAEAARSDPSTVLVFCDEHGLGEGLAARFRRTGRQVVMVRPGDAQGGQGDLRTLNPTSPEDYEALLDELAAPPGEIVHLWSVGSGPGAASDENEIDSVQALGFESVLQLVRVVGERAGHQEVGFTLVASGMAGVTAGDQISPAKATLLGPCRVIPFEYPHLSGRCIDLEVPASEEARTLLVEQVFGEVESRASDQVVAYRGRNRYVQSIVSEPLGPAADGVRLRQGGVYLLTGGLGGLGLSAGRHLAEKYQARLVLLSRSSLPPRERWESLRAGAEEDVSPTRRAEAALPHRIREVMAIEELGGEVLLLAADVTDRDQMRAAVQKIKERFGELHGVFHTAGVIGSGLISFNPKESIERVMAPKLAGTLVLDEVLAGVELDFLVLYSSIASLIGGPGQVAYSAANAFLDAFAQYRSRRGDWTVAVGWGEWQWNVWEGFAPTVQAFLDENKRRFGISEDEGFEALERVLSQGQSHVAVTTRPFEAVREFFSSLAVDNMLAASESPAAGAAPMLGDGAPLPVGDELERMVLGVWQGFLGVDKLGLDDNFFDVGGNSLVGLQIINELRRTLGVELPKVALFRAPTVRALTGYLEQGSPQTERAPALAERVSAPPAEEAVAIVGMGARFPGAANVQEFWRNLAQGVESLSHFTDDQLKDVDAALLADPNYVKARPVLSDVDLFDANFFGYSPREARLMDPQLRVFLETCWEALEASGYAVDEREAKVGVFAGSNISTYLLGLIREPGFVESVGELETVITNDRDSLTTSVSYKLNLKGPSLAVQTFCSTSAVAIHLACQSVRRNECDMALAGGVSVRVPANTGYLYRPGDQYSPDGHTRAFDHQARGTVFGDGVGVVVLKRLSAAIRDRDHIHAVIRGSAVNNDGSLKAGYTAPSIEGQAEVVATALADAGVDASDLGYVEAHGTATVLGDPIEVAALTQAFRLQTKAVGYCALGSVKTNIGHLDRAAGVASVIKTTLALEHHQLPPSLHFERPNPEIDFDAGPFYVNSELADWTGDGGPRRAAINSLGIGGTNAHLILEEAPEREPADASRRYQLLLLSARSERALDEVGARLVRHLREADDSALPDVAYTLQVGRKPFPHRRMLVCGGREDAVAALETKDARVADAVQHPASRPVTFLFPGVGEHYIGMASGLYRDEPVFREQVDRCAGLLTQMGEDDLLAVLFPPSDEPEASTAGGEGTIDLRRMLRRDPEAGEELGQLSEIRTLHPALFVIEYALARLLMSWGLEPRAMLGYSLGEYVAACLSGVFSLGDALRLMAIRGRWLDELPEGAMVAVPLAEAEIRPMLGDQLALAANNGPGGVVVSGPTAEIAELEARLTLREVVSWRLRSTRAFHSHHLDPVAGRVAALVSTMRLRAPRVPFFSCVSGTWIRPEEATDPEYWARHLCHTVRFSESVQVLLGETAQVLLEVGPGRGLTSFVRLHEGCDATRAALVQPTLRPSFERRPDQAFLLESLGRLWLGGVAIDWNAFYGDERRRRVPLPTYPFERRRFWMTATATAASEAPRALPPATGQAEPRVTGLEDLVREAEVEKWFYLPVWRRSAPRVPDAVALGDGSNRGPWWAFVDSTPLSCRLLERLADRGEDIVVVEAGAAYAGQGRRWVVDPHEPEHYRRLVRDLIAAGGPPRHVLHLWNLGADDAGERSLTETLDLGFHSVVYLARSLVPSLERGAELNLFSSGVYRVLGDEALRPYRATLSGPTKVVPLEYPTVSTRHFDLDLPQPGSAAEDRLLEGVIAELYLPPSDRDVAYRTGERWTRSFEQRPLFGTPDQGANLGWRQGGVYLITGGLGGIGLATAEHLAKTCGARLALVGRTALPPRDQWDHILAGADLEQGEARKIATVRALEAQGTELLVLSGDVADRGQMREVVDRILDRFGALNGVLHTAGVPAAGLMHGKTADDFAEVLAPKIQGTLVLEEVLRDVPVDVIVLFSSITAIVGGGPGQVDYCAANAFLDAFAQARTRPDRPVVSIDWAEWRWNAWESSMAGLPAPVVSLFRQTRERLGIDVAGGMDAMERVLNARLPSVVVSPSNFAAMVAISETYTVDLLLGQATGDRQGDLSGSAGLEPGAPSAPGPVGRDFENRIAKVWGRALGLDRIDPSDNFFDLGGNSLVGLKVISELQRELKRDVPPLALYEAPTVRALARHLEPDRATDTVAAASAATRDRGESRGDEIAVIGMAGRFPGASSVDELWHNLLEGREGVTFFDDEELLAAGVDPTLLENPRYVKAGSVLEDIDRFDAELFGESPREAELLDPQHRLFLECAWAALDDAGYDPDRYPGRVGVFGGSNLSTYLIQMAASPDLLGSLHPMLAGLGNSSDSLTTRVSYKLNLRGPSVAVQTFCSTSAVASHLACRSLQQGECDMALAGGVRVAVPHRVGYLYESGGIDSPDGHTRTFDASGRGALLGNGVAILVLKPLDAALADRDHIYSVIKGSAINNDGAGKVGYTAPSVGALSDVVSEAFEKARVSPATISYVEAHGTATEIGDPIEVAALTRAFRAFTDQEQYCAIGSVKSNLGHLDRAAGATALIKASLSLERGQLPPSLHFEEPNPKLDLEHSPFFVQTERTPWERNGGPRRASVNALGIGGTNVHFVLEEPPNTETVAAAPSRSSQLLLLSARTASALETMTDRLAAVLRGAPDGPALPDVAATLQQGRRLLSHRRMLVSDGAADAVSCLESRTADRLITHVQESTRRPVVFLFPGLGDHYVDMTQGLYRHERRFREVVDRSAERLEPILGIDVRDVIFSGQASDVGGGPPKVDLRRLMGRGGEENAASRRLNQTRLTQPAVFVVEYALTQLLLEWGLAPQAMLGYSLGEYVAATVAGVFSFEDALELVARRAQLIDSLPRGAMLAVPVGEAHARELLASEEGAGLSLAALNGPRLAVLAGPEAAVHAVEARLDREETAYRRLQTSHAFHSAMMDPIAESFTQLFDGIDLQPPQIPYLSNVSGGWIRAEEATAPAYWARHMCQTVRFEDGLREVLRDPDRVVLEVGPGQTLTSLAKLHPEGSDRVVLGTVRGAHVASDDQRHLLETLGKLWLSGVAVDWEGFYREERRHRVALPGYPFEGERYWIGPRESVLPTAIGGAAEPGGAKKPELADWYYRPGWREEPLPEPVAAAEAAASETAPGGWLVFVDDLGVGRRVVEGLSAAVSELALVVVGDRFAHVSENEWQLDPSRGDDYSRLLQELGWAPRRVVHLWSLTADAGGDLDAHQERGFFSLLLLAQALGRERVTGRLRLDVVTNRLEAVIGGEPIEAAKWTLTAASKVLPQEYPSLSSRLIEVDPIPGPDVVASSLVSELLHGPATDLEVAYRKGVRWLRHFAPVRLESPEGSDGVRDGGVYLITGGLGGVGLVLAEELARHHARLVLVGRSGLPERERWQGWLAEHGEDDATSRRICRVEALEDLGAEVLVLSADVGDAAGLREVLSRVDSTYGDLHGVLHAAGVTGREDFVSVQQTGPDLCARHFRAKVRGLEALAEALGDRRLDFCLLFSSLSSVLGGLGFAAYAAANSYMNGFAVARSQGTRSPWLSVAWDSWRLESGAMSEAQEMGLESTVAEYSMTPSEGVESFRRVLAAHAGDPSFGPVLVHSTGDLDARIEQWLLRMAEQPARPERSRYTRPDLRTAYVPVNSETERKVARVFEEVLGIEKVGIHDNYFDLGGTSLTAIQVAAELQKDFPDTGITPITLFGAPTVAELARFLGAEDGTDEAISRLRAAVAESPEPLATRESIAIIGMSGRFPGAHDIGELWRNLVAGSETVSFFSDEELLESGVDVSLVRNPDYVRARPVLDDVDVFDAGFFGYSPTEAALLDPQIRLFLESSWEALESAGYAGESHEKVGVFSGSNFSTYFLAQLRNSSFLDEVGELQAAITNDRDSLATSVSYKLDLRGPSLTVQTFCSTSAVAAHLACQSLRQGECGMALAGGVNVRVPVKVGHLYQAGDQVSPDGHTRTFDHRAGGTVFGDGVGVLVLKRVSDALRDGDQIHAVIRGSAINNDGSGKVGYTAPSVEGQAEVVATALANAGVEASEVGFVEAHGTATVLGDPIEVEALTRAFRLQTEETGFCALGSVKTNMGHLDRAAGVTALIKTTLALEHGQIPASLHFERPNPKIDFESSPFFVNTELRDWKRNGRPRLAGVNSLGVGGTNVHLVLEEAPEPPPTSESRRHQLLVVSARSAAGLDASCSRLAGYLESEPDSDLADVAYTLQLGRKSFAHRRMVVCTDPGTAVSGLTADGGSPGVASAVQEPVSRQVAFLFPGIGEHYVGMAEGLYRDEPVFRDELERCASILAEQGMDNLLSVLYPEGRTPAPTAGDGGLDLRRMLRGGGEGDEASVRLNQIGHLHPVLFSVEYALARLLMTWGVVPQAMLGYSLGEYVAACLSGVFSLKDALQLIAARGRWSDELAEGAMLAVPLSESEIASELGDDLDLAAVNGTGGCVVSGSPVAIASLESRLAERDVVSRRLRSTRAFHSRQLEPVAERMVELLSGMTLSAPRIPFVSNVTGSWITPDQATDPGYWASHLCRTVRFSDGVAELLREPSRVLVEVGPGQGLTSFVRLQPECDADRATRVRPTLRGAFETRSDQAYLVESVGRLWLAGVKIDWRGFYRDERRRRRSLPTYPFDRQRYWLETPSPAPALPAVARSLEDVIREPAVEDWFYAPVWERAPLRTPASNDSMTGSCWVFVDAAATDSDPVGFSERVTRGLEGRGEEVYRIIRGRDYRREGRTVTVDPSRPDQYGRLVQELGGEGHLPRRVVHLWDLETGEGGESLEQTLDHGFHSLICLAQALGPRIGDSEESHGDVKVDVTVVSRGVHPVTGDEALRPERATVIGPVKLLPVEYPSLSCRHVDIDVEAPGSDTEALLAEKLLDELVTAVDERVVAYRQGERWTRSFARRSLPPAPAAASARFRRGGVYLITGGLGGLGLATAEHLASTLDARLVLVGRTALPPREDWDGILAEGDVAEGMARTVAKVRALEERGTELLVLAADVALRDQMRSVVDKTLGRFGALHGVLHTAAVPAAGLMQHKTASDFARVLDPKVRGTRVLEEVLRGLPLDFLVLFSSVTSVSGGGPGQVDYCAANAYLDAFAQAHSTPDRVVVSISWNEWRWNAWTAGMDGLPPDVQRFFVETRERLGIDFAGGMDALERIVSSDLPYLVVSPADLPAVLELGRDYTVDLLTGKAAGGTLLDGVELESVVGRHVRPELEVAYVPASGDFERRIAEVWQRVLGIEEVGVSDNFFDLGGNSLIGLKITTELQRALDRTVLPLALYEAPTVRDLARHLRPEGAQPPVSPRPRAAMSEEGIAIVGMAGRFPGAASVDELWQNLRAGREGITFFSDDELLAAGIDPALVEDPRYVKAGAVLDDIDRFDADLFEVPPGEAELLDPQHRLFLECAWAALDDAGHDPARYPGRIGVFGGSNLSTYLLQLVGASVLDNGSNRRLVGQSNSADSLTTRVSYKLNLRGPSVSVQTFCSTSGVATHLACESLQRGHCEMALAGGVQVSVPHRVGYLYEPGGIDSSDGHTRTFASHARGALHGNGVAIMVLKRLGDALRDGDHIYSVIKGSAINNDGSGKVGYTAPSVNAVAAVVSEALDQAGVSPSTISYVEAHGTATEVGDAIEVAALTKAFQTANVARDEETQYCAIGSVKSNVGHLDIAAGTTALIKTALALQHGEIPSSLHAGVPNPQLHLEQSPFYVQKDRAEWRSNGSPRRAGVNIQGIGGTNVHFILEEPPPIEAAVRSSRPLHLLVLSANTASALEAMTDRLATRLRAAGEGLDLADVCATLQRGRQRLAHRRFVVCGDTSDAVSCLESRDVRRVSSRVEPSARRPVYFLFPGDGAPCPGMGQDLYEHGAEFRAQVDSCCQELQPHLGRDLRALLFPLEEEKDTAARQLTGAGLTQPALFVLEYALARQWMAWGVEPQMMCGDGIGEYVAACLAGVFSLPDALALAVARGRLIADPGSEIVRDRFQERVATVRRSPPGRPWISSVTGSQIRPEQALDPGYWALQTNEPTRPDDCLDELLAEPRIAFLEVGPGSTLTDLVRARAVAGPLLLLSLSDAPIGGSALAGVLDTMGTLWQVGAEIDWEAFHCQERRLRVSLPAYPFEGDSHWIGPGAPGRGSARVPGRGRQGLPGLVRSIRATGARWLAGRRNRRAE
jgi:acyl transferase domain-containing protein/acyl carrier protein